MVDIFRKTYKPLNEDEKREIDSIKDLAQEMYEIIDMVSTVTLGDTKEKAYDQRALALAKTKLEESVMWAVKGISS